MLMKYSCDRRRRRGVDCGISMDLLKVDLSEGSGMTKCKGQGKGCCVLLEATVPNLAGYSRRRLGHDDHRNTLLTYNKTLRL